MDISVTDFTSQDKRLTSRSHDVEWIDPYSGPVNRIRNKMLHVDANLWRTWDLLAAVTVADVALLARAVS